MKKKYFLEEEFWETLSPQPVGLTLPQLTQILASTPSDEEDLPHPSQSAISQALVSKEHKYRSSGAHYQGEWLGGFRHGRGKMVWADGAQFEGQWVLGRAFGHGVFTHTKGEVYDGLWSYDKAHGRGLYIHSNGARYEGYWYQDL